MVTPAVPRQIAADTYLLVESGWGRLAGSSVYLIVGEQAAIVEPGPATQVEAILRALAALGLDPAQIAYVAPTHIHLDHGGGAGLLSQRLPRARVVVCANGARHVIEPTKLIAGTRSSFGDDYERWYGPIEPVDRERVLSVCEGDVVELGHGHHLRIFHTSGHASHHHSLYDEGTATLFPGEAAGFYLADRDLLVPSTAAGPFDLDVALKDLGRLATLEIRGMAYSHWGFGPNGSRLLQEASCRLEEWGESLLGLFRSGTEKLGNEGDEMARGTTLFVGLALDVLKGCGYSPEESGRLDEALRRTLPRSTVMGYLEYFRRRGLR